MQNFEQIFSVKGRVILITGGAGFLGTEYANFLAQAGAKVVILDRVVPARLSENIIAFSQDVTDPLGVRKVINKIVKRWGRIDVLINNAALTYSPVKEESQKQFLPYEKYPLNLWNQAIQVGLSGSFVVSKEVISVMKKQRRGAILNIGSVYGEVAHDNRIYTKGKFGSIAYATSKGALPNFTRELASYLAPFGIRVNLLTLGGVRKNQNAAFVKKYSARTMLGRMAEKNDFNGALVFLISDASNYMTGSNLIIDGGWTAW